MKETRKNYSKEFKQKAVELSNVRGNVQEIARELGVPAEFIYRWRKEQNLNPSLAFSGNGNKQLTEEQKELAKLKRELAAHSSSSVLASLFSNFLSFSFVTTTPSLF